MNSQDDAASHSEEEQVPQNTLSGASLGDWARTNLGLCAGPISVFEANVRFAVKAMQAINALEFRLDEEGLTSSLVGSLAASLPISALAFGAEDVPGGSFGWAQYSKSGRGRYSESQKGADFALVITLPNNKVRLALFQAKSDASASRVSNSIKLHQVRKEEGKPDVLQVRMLVDTACDIMRRAGIDGPGTQHASWVHYLCQIEMGVRCVQMSNLTKEVMAELAGTGGSNIYYVDESNSIPFLAVLADAYAPDAQYWIELEQKEVDHLLPDLISMEALAELMDLLVSDDGTGKWGNVPGGLERTEICEPVTPTTTFDAQLDAPAFRRPGY